MRICIYVQDISTYLGGVQSVVALMAKKLSELGHEVTLLCPPTEVHPKLQRPIAPGVQVVRTDHLSVVERPRRLQHAASRLLLALVKRNPWSKLPAVLNSLLARAFLAQGATPSVVSYLSRASFDVVIGAGASQTFTLALSAQRLEARLIGWQHSTFDSYFLTRGQNLHGLRSLAGVCFPSLNAVLVLNSSDKVKFDQAFAIDSTVFSNPVELTRLRRRSAWDVKALVYVGRLNFDVKGLDLLIDAFKLVCNRHPDWKLRIFGDGPDKAALCRLIAEQGLQDNVELLGATKDVVAALESGSIFVLPSRYEGFGIALVEAMRMGLPSVSFATDGPRDILESGSNGYLVQKYDTVAFADRVGQLIDDPDQRRRMGECAAFRAGEFDPKFLVPQFERLLKEA